MAKENDAREAKTVSYGEYQKLHDNSKENVTVRMINGDTHRSMDPVKIVQSEAHEMYPEFNRDSAFSNKSIFENDEENNEKTTQPQRGFLQRAGIFSPMQKPAGWLVCVEGPDFGKCFPLKEGINYIGRADNMDVVVKNDMAVSRNKHAWIEYREKDRSFYVSAGEAHKLVYLNDDILLMPEIMKKNDILAMGNSSLMLIPCCDEKFSWSTASEK